MHREFKREILTGTIENATPIPRMLRDMVFKEMPPSYAQTLTFDVVINGETVLPAVSPVEGGVVIEKDKRLTKTVEFPRIRIKAPFKAKELITERGIGEASFSDKSWVKKARAQAVSKMLEKMKNSIGLTTEMWCGQMISTGKILVEHENYSFELDINMPTANKPTATTLWSDTANADIVGDIEDWGGITSDSGFDIDKAFMSSAVWKVMYKNTGVMDALDNRGIVVGQLKAKIGMSYKGNLNGVDLYVYNKKYTPFGGGAASPIIPNDRFIMVASNGEFPIEYGPILDLEAANPVSKYFSKPEMKGDPSVLNLIAESRPIPYIKTPEAVVSATVI